MARQRWRHPIVVALAAMAALTAISAGAAAAGAPPAQPVIERAPRESGEPIMAIVSLKSQQVTFYDADGWFLRAPVSTGTTGRETPAGVFAVIEKDKDHHSTMYDDAWMPNMLRITWNGLALHGGPLPGYAASHGCVRMPYSFAEEVFDKAWIGMRVIISPTDAVPVAFSHPALFEPDPAALAAAPPRAETLDLQATTAVEAARSAKDAAATAALKAKSLVALVRKLTLSKTRTDAALASANQVLAAADGAKARAMETEQKAAAAAADLATQLDTANANANANADALAAASATASADGTANEAAATAADDAKSLAALVRTLTLSKTRADAQLASADKALAAADKAKARAADAQQKAATAAADLATQLETAQADAKAGGDAAAAAAAAAKTAETDKAAAASAASEAKLLLEPVSIYISRATQMLYVRRNTHAPARDGGGEVFDTSIEVPVTIRDPDKPIGTHVFTAMAGSDGGLRWSAVTIDGADNATDALDRITIPQDVLDRIAPTALPRSSIIVSDEPLSRETNYRTEFVSVLSDYPQGGFLTRRPSVDVASQSPDAIPVSRPFGFFSLFRRN